MARRHGSSIRSMGFFENIVTSYNHFMEFDAFLKIFDWRINLQVFFMDVPGVTILNACGPEWIIACTKVGGGTDALIVNDSDVDFAICILVPSFLEVNMFEKF